MRPDSKCQDAILHPSFPKALFLMHFPDFAGVVVGIKSSWPQPNLEGVVWMSSVEFEQKGIYVLPQGENTKPIAAGIV